MVHVAEGGLREVRGDTSVAVQARAVATVDARARVALVEELEKVEAQRRAEAASIPGSGGAAVGQVLMPAGGRAVPWGLCAGLDVQQERREGEGGGVGRGGGVSGGGAHVALKSSAEPSECFCGCSATASHSFIWNIAK